MADCGSDVPDPDPNIGVAALRTAELGQEAWDWYKNYFSSTLAPLQAEQAQINRQAAGQALRIAADQESRAADSYAYQQGTFRPVEQAIASEALNFNRDAYRDQRAALAGAEVQSAFDASERQMNRDFARMGIAPTSGQAIAMKQGSALARAANVASASNAAREAADAVGFARLQTAAGLGRNISTDAATNAQIALSGGNTGSAIAGRSSESARADAATVGQGVNTAISGNAAAGNLWAESSRQAQQGAISNNNMVGDVLGSVAGAGAYKLMGLSDPKAKKDIKRVDDEAALEVVRGEPVSGYTYKKGKGDGKRHVGPMADDVAEMIGGDPRYVDLGDQLGVQLAAIRALDRTVQRLVKQKER